MWCDKGYVGYTRRHLHQRVAQECVFLYWKHSCVLNDLTKNFTILKKCKNKFDCLIYEMFFINKLRPTLRATGLSA